MENPSKSEVIGRCGGDEKTNDNTEPPKVESPNLKKINNSTVQGLTYNYHTQLVFFLP